MSPTFSFFCGVAFVEHAALERSIAETLGALGFELVDLRFGGSTRRPLLSVRIDRAGDGPDRKVTVDDCAIASRALEAWMDRDGVGGGRYILEVSSPGMDRPLKRLQDWQRFQGRLVDVLVPSLGGRFRVTLAAVTTEPEPTVTLAFPKGEQKVVRLADIKEARLGYEW